MDFHKSICTFAALLVGLRTGTGTSNRSDDRTRQELKMAFDGAVDEQFLVSLTAGSRCFYSARLQDDRAVEWLFIPSLSALVSRSVGVYVDSAGFYEAMFHRHWLVSGLTIRPGADTQYDLNTGLQIGARGDAFFLGRGWGRSF